LLGPELGRRLNDVPDGFGWLQYSLAKRAQRPILQWRSPELKDLLTVEDSRQRRLLEGADAMSFEDFKQAIVRSVASVPSKPIRPSFFFINIDAVDTDEADEIGQQLGGEVDWERPPYEDKPEPGILQNKIDTNLVDCDGLFIVQGKVKPDWVRDQLQQYRKARWRRATAPRVLAVVQTGETPHELKGVGVAGLKIIGIDDIPDVVKSALAS
jgi:hypothetical protein